jgi:hypothetical protein
MDTTHVTEPMQCVLGIYRRRRSFLGMPRFHEVHTKQVPVDESDAETDGGCSMDRN